MLINKQQTLCGANPSNGARLNTEHGEAVSAMAVHCFRHRRFLENKLEGQYKALLQELTGAFSQCSLQVRSSQRAACDRKTSMYCSLPHISRVDELPSCMGKGSHSKGFTLCDRHTPLLMLLQPLFPGRCNKKVSFCADVRECQAYASVCIKVLQERHLLFTLMNAGTRFLSNSMRP